MTIGHHRYPDGLRADPAVGVRTEGNKAEFGPIKVDQGEINKKNAEEQDELVGCPTSRRNRQPQSACGAGKICRSATDSTSGGLKAGIGMQASVWVHHDGAHGVTRPTRVSVGKNCHAVSTTAGGARTDVNKAKFGSIKVHQGEIFKKVEEQNEMEGGPADCGDGPSPLRGRWFPDSLSAMPAVDGFMAGVNRTQSELIGLNRGEIFYPGQEGPGTMRFGHAFAFAKDSLIKHDMQGSNPAGHEINFLHACVQVGAN